MPGIASRRIERPSTGSEDRLGALAIAVLAATAFGFSLPFIAVAFSR